ncbi:hypothetical protein DICVIV_03524 [Dictyocaulus viviparus]|uniref:Uncharacterized protein n=1 Tax=Dictyocaulus viviparus TaxID=29172 RepID=A0A0D8Y0W1_DICVI|nr:hypothetical protein DICVIV_03524 [Dictyocaulus viviparus]
MSIASSSSASTEQNTFQYARMLGDNKSANTSMSSQKSRGSSHYPTVCVQVPHAPVTRVASPPHIVSYAIPYPKPVQYSAAQLQYENIKHRCKMLDAENQRLMRVQNELITDANRRVEMHVNEIRMLKEENKRLTAANKELRDLCCFLDDDRLKIRRLAKEWQKFGRYTSQTMKQEMAINQQRFHELEERHMDSIRENDELKQLCLYLDEQRQRFTGYSNEDDRESEDLGCGSSERSEEYDESKNACDIPRTNPQKENALRMISQQIGSSAVSVRSVVNEHNAHAEQIVNYIHSLEGRIKQLEKTTHQNDLWHSECAVASDSDEKTVINRCEEFLNGVITAKPCGRDTMQTSYCKLSKKLTLGTLTTSGTTYASSDTDMESAVYVMGDEIGGFGSLEVHSLTKIDEEDKDKSVDDVEEESAKLPPSIAPLSESLASRLYLNVGRLSLTNSDLSLSLNRPFEDSQPRRCSSSSAVPTTSFKTWKRAIFGSGKGPCKDEKSDNEQCNSVEFPKFSNSTRCDISAV